MEHHGERTKDIVRNDVYPAGNVVGAGANDVAVERSADGMRALARIDVGRVRRAFAP
jgi:hypothetical protein